MRHLPSIFLGKGTIILSRNNKPFARWLYGEESIEMLLCYKNGLGRKFKTNVYFNV